MTLEDMQTVWSEMTEKMDKQKRLTDKLIMDMTQEKFKNKISNISKYESFGAMICFIMALLIIFNLDKLNTWYLLVCGLVSASYLIFIPIIVLRYIHNMKTIDLANNTYKDSLVEFARRRKRFLFWQRLVIVLNFLLMFVILPVTSMLFNGRDLFLEGGNVWTFYILGMVMFLVPFSLWGYRSYKRMTATAESILEELSQAN